MAKILRDAFASLLNRATASIPAGASVIQVVTDYGHRFLRDLIKQAELTDLAGPEKRKVVLEYVSAWYDRVIPGLPLPLPGLLAIWMAPVRPFLRPYVKGFALEAAGYLLERILANLKEDQAL